MIAALPSLPSLTPRIAACVARLQVSSRGAVAPFVPTTSVASSASGSSLASVSVAPSSSSSTASRGASVAASTPLFPLPTISGPEDAGIAAVHAADGADPKRCADCVNAIMRHHFDTEVSSATRPLRECYVRVCVCVCVCVCACV